MLEKFGLTKQEICVYNQTSVATGKTGYTIAKDINMSRSNVYPILNSLVKKGAVIYEDGESRKYYRVNPEEFMENYIRELSELKQQLVTQLQEEEEAANGYFTIEGATNIRNQMRHLVDNAKERVYACGKREDLFFLHEEFAKLCDHGKKVVVITDAAEGWDENIQLYITEHDLVQVGLIADSTNAMVGDVKDEDGTCLYSANKNFVNTYKMNLKNEIEIIEMKRC